MLTDRPPRNAALLAQFVDSDRLVILELPQDDLMRAAAESIDSAMRPGKSAAVREACAAFLTLASDFYRVPKPLVRVLAARPVRVREGGKVLDRISLDRGCFACMLGGPDGRTLFVIAREWHGARDMHAGAGTGQVLMVPAPAPAAGWA